MAHYVARVSITRVDRKANSTSDPVYRHGESKKEARGASREIESIMEVTLTHQDLIAAVNMTESHLAVLKAAHEEEL